MSEMGYLTDQSALTIRARERAIEDWHEGMLARESVTSIEAFVDMLIAQQLVSDRFFQVYGSHGVVS